MSRIQPSLLARLRRHRGLWVLAALVLVFKLASGSACLADAPSAALTAHASTAATAMTASAPLSGDTAPDPGCLLGEVGGCHCACAHAMPVPAAAVAAPIVPVLALVPSAVPSGVRVVLPGSPLRPPIA